VLTLPGVHRDSVWALAATEGFSAVLSGGRDGRVCRTPLSQPQAAHELLLVEPHQRQIRALARAARPSRARAALAQRSRSARACLPSGCARDGRRPRPLARPATDADADVSLLASQSAAPHRRR